MKNKKQFSMRVARGRHTDENNYLQQYAKCMGYDGRWIGLQLQSIEENKFDNSFTNFVLL